MESRKLQMSEGIELRNREKNQNAGRKGNLQIDWNIGSGHHQTYGDEGKRNARGERENYSKPNYIAETSSKGLIPELYSEQDIQNHS